MNTQFKKAWVTALRSGHYRQSIHSLRTPDDAYCCLGVLCDLAVHAGYGHWTLEDDGLQYYTVDPTGERNPEAAETFSPVSLPRPLREALGLTWTDVNDLIELNDLARANFAEIADHVERRVPDTESVFPPRV